MSYQVWRVLRRMEDTRIITEDGVYLKGQVPESYGGFELTVKYTQRLLMTNNAGEILELRFDNVTEVKDKTEKTGLGLVYQYDVGASKSTEIMAAAGPSEAVIDVVSTKGDWLSAGNSSRAEKVFAHMLKEVTD